MSSTPMSEVIKQPPLPTGIPTIDVNPEIKTEKKDEEDKDIIEIIDVRASQVSPNQVHTPNNQIPQVRKLKIQSKLHFSQSLKALNKNREINSNQVTFCQNFENRVCDTIGALTVIIHVQIKPLQRKSQNYQKT